MATELRASDVRTPLIALVFRMNELQHLLTTPAQHAVLHRMGTQIEQLINMLENAA